MSFKATKEVRFPAGRAEVAIKIGLAPVSRSIAMIASSRESQIRARASASFARRVVLAAVSCFPMIDNLERELL